MVIITIALFLFPACSGEDGAVGPAGASGSDGSPQPVNLLVLGADYETKLEDMVINLTAWELFPIGTQISYYSTRIEDGSIPTLQEIEDYDVLLVNTNYAPIDPVALGDVLADYVDGGGGLVITQHSFLSTTFDIEGRIMDEGYSPFHSAGGAGLGDRTIDASTVSIPIHPIFNGTDIESLVLDNATYYSNPVLASGATALAYDTFGHAAIAINADGNIIGINTYGEYFSNSTYLGAYKVIANSCLFVAGAF